MIYHVSTTGSDTNPGTQDAPFGSIQKAVDAAETGDAVKVASGTYVMPFWQKNSPNVLSVIRKSIAVLGGFSAAWETTQDKSVLHGQDKFRGIWLGNGGLELRNFVVTNCHGKGFQSIFSRPQDSPGGGLYALSSELIVDNCVFQNNISEGQDTDHLGGLGVGGGMGLFSMTKVKLSNIVFRDNVVKGGQGKTSANYGQGGGLFTNEADTEANNLVFLSCHAKGGFTDGPGSVDGYTDASTGRPQYADGQGGAFDLVGGKHRWNNLIVRDCSATGGDAPNGYAGGGFAGGGQVERADFELHDGLFRGCAAVGGNGKDVQLSLGGGFNATNCSTKFVRVHLLENSVVGGTKANKKGAAGGGGFGSSNFLCDKDAEAAFVDCVAAGNKVTVRGDTHFGEDGGGGGALWFQGVRWSFVGEQNQGILDNNVLTGGFVINGRAVVGVSQDAPRMVDGSVKNCVISNHPRLNFGDTRACVYLQSAWPRHSGQINFTQVVWWDYGFGNGYSSNNGKLTETLRKETNPNYSNPQEFDFRPKNAQKKASPVLFSLAGWSFKHTTSSGPVNLFSFGNGLPVAGKWDGKTFGVGVLDGSVWLLRNTVSPGAPDYQFEYGAPGWLPIAGDWDGDGKFGVGVFDPSSATWYLRDDLSSGSPDHKFEYGAPGWKPVVGDWDGDGKFGVGVFDPFTTTWHLRNDPSPGPADIVIQGWGWGGWLPVAGDWEGSGKYSVGIYDSSQGKWYLRGEGEPDFSFDFGVPGGMPVSAVL